MVCELFFSFFEVFNFMKLLILVVFAIPSLAQITTTSAPTVLSSSGAVTAGHCPQFGATPGTLTDTGSACGSGGGGGAFSGITSGTNTGATMVVGTGASLSPSGSGTVNANQVNGAAVPANASLLSTNSSGHVIGPYSVAAGASGAFSVPTISGTVFTGDCAAWFDGSITDAGNACGTITSIFGNAGPAITALVVPSGDSINPSGTGVVNANQVNGAAVPASTSMIATNSSGQIVANSFQIPVSGQMNSSVAGSANTTYSAGQDGAGGSGSVDVRGANNTTGSGGNTSLSAGTGGGSVGVGGYVFIRAGSNSSSVFGVQPGATEIGPGFNTGSTNQTIAPLIIENYYTRTSGAGSSVAWALNCFTGSSSSTATVSECGSNPSNFVGVGDAGGDAALTQVQIHVPPSLTGIQACTSNRCGSTTGLSFPAVTVGHTACAGNTSASAAFVYDSGGSSPCTGGITVGVFVDVASDRAWITADGDNWIPNCVSAPSTCVAAVMMYDRRTQIGSGDIGVPQGNGGKIQLSTGSTTTNDCVKFDANGNTVDAGAACGSGGGVTAVTGTSPIVSSGGSTPAISIGTAAGGVGVSLPSYAATGSPFTAYGLQVAVPSGGTTNLSALFSGTVGTNPEVIIQDTAATGSSGTGLGIYNSYTDTGARNWGIAQAVAQYGDLAFRQSNAKGGNPFSAGTTRVLLDSFGNTTLGTSGSGTATKALLLPVLSTSILTYDTSGTPSVNKWAFYNSPGTFVGGAGFSTNSFDLLNGPAGGFNWYTGTTSYDGTGATNIMSLNSSGNLGIGTKNQGARVTSTGDVFVTNSTHGVILTDSAAACWRIVVAPTTGLLSTSSVTCPTF